jgi:hypothetical protein
MSRGSVSGRSLRRELRERFGAVGKTARVFQIWREEAFPQAQARVPPVTTPAATEAATCTASASSNLPADIADLQRRLATSDLAAAEHLARAERAEYREQAHQEKWAVEIDRLRQELKMLKAGELRNR